MTTVVLEQTALSNIGLNVSLQGDIQVVNARDLHSELGSKRDFTNWINDRIKNYGFIDGIDYTTNLLNRSDGKPGKPKKEYILLLNTAKEIAMLENNDKGRQIRRYLIEIENKYRNQSKILTSEDIIDGLNKLIKETEITNTLNLVLEDAVHKARVSLDAYNKQILELRAENNKLKTLQNTNTSLGIAKQRMSIEEAGVQLGMSRPKLFAEMRAKKFLKLDNSPYKKYEGKYFIQDKVKYKKGKNWNVYYQTFVLPKGLELLKNIFKIS